MESKAHLFLPLYRWLEGASSVPHSPGGVDFWAWPINLMLAGSGWLWRIYRWLADMSARAISSPDDSFRSELESRIETVVTTLWNPLFTVVPATAIVILLVRFAARRVNSRDGIMEFFKITVFSTLAFMFFSANLFAVFVGWAQSAVNDVAEVPADIAARNVSDKITQKTQKGAGGVIETGDDVLGCSRYIDVLLEIGSEAHPVQQIMSAWAMWSHYPFWVAGSYGRDTGGTASRMFCHELEILGGMPAYEQRQIALCAAASPPGGVSATTITNRDCEAGGWQLMGMVSREDLGPFRDYIYRGNERQQTRSAAAWAMCLRENGKWKIHDGFKDFVIVHPETEKPVSVEALFVAHNVCEQWMTGEKNTALAYSTCLPFMGSKSGCGDIGTTRASIALQRSPVDVVPGSEVFDTHPSLYINWQEIASEPTAAQLEAINWIKQRGSGTPGIGEAVAAFFALLSSFVYFPLGVGMAGVYVFAVWVLALLVGFAPIWMLFGVFERGRKFALSAIKYSLALLLVSIVVIVMMSVFTLIFGWVAGIVGVEASGFVTLIGIAVTPFLTMQLINRMGRYAPSQAAFQKPLWSAEGVANIGIARKSWQKNMDRYAVRPKQAGRRLYSTVRGDMLSPVYKKIKKQSAFVAARGVTKVAPTSKETFMHGESVDIGNQKSGKESSWESAYDKLPSAGKVFAAPIAAPVIAKKVARKVAENVKKEYGIPSKRQETYWSEAKKKSAAVVDTADEKRREKLSKAADGNLPDTSKKVRPASSAGAQQAADSRKSKRIRAMEMYAVKLKNMDKEVRKEVNRKIKKRNESIAKQREEMLDEKPQGFVSLGHLMHGSSDPEMVKKTSEDRLPQFIEKETKAKFRDEAMVSGIQAYALKYQHIGEHVASLAKTQYNKLTVAEVNALIAFIRPMSEAEQKQGGSRKLGIEGLDREQSNMDNTVRRHLYHSQRSNFVALRAAVAAGRKGQIEKIAHRITAEAKSSMTRRGSSQLDRNVPDRTSPSRKGTPERKQAKAFTSKTGGKEKK